MAMDTSEIGTVPSRALELNKASLLSFLQKELPFLFDSAGHLEILQLTYGQSNPTYIVKGRGTSYVLRKKPPGRLLQSAHNVEREFEVLRALENTGLPIPQTLCLCTDESVIGTPFFFMEHIKGIVYSDANLPMLNQDERREVYASMAVTLAKLHSIRPSDIGLLKYGKAKDYCKRQVARWWRQYMASINGQPNQYVAMLKEWLASNIPKWDGMTREGSIAHGDFKIDNLIFSKSRPRHVKAVLDWELSTLGDPWADVAYCCLPYYMPAVPFLPALNYPLLPGIPSEGEFVAMYCKAAGLDLLDARQWAFYKCLALFRIASIVQGVGARAKQGNASSKWAEKVGSGAVVESLVRRGLDIIGAMESGHEEAGGKLPGSSMESGGSHGFKLSNRVQQLREKLKRFMNEKIYPVEAEMDRHCKSDDRWTVPQLMDDLKNEAKQCGLWNLWLPADTAEKIKGLVHEVRSSKEAALLMGPGLTNLEYAHLSEIMGRCFWASEVFNCSAPDTGNMELLARYGSVEQQKRWLIPLLEGKIRSCFGMTERHVASSDASNIQSSIVRHGDHYVLNGRKWWTSGAMHPDCRLCIFMGKTDKSATPYRQQSMVLVPMDSPGIEVMRPMLVFGYDDAPEGHAEVNFTNVRVPCSSLLYGEGTGFEMAQSRLGPGRLHHCMRLVGLGERGLELMCARAKSRVAFGQALARNPSVQVKVAQCRIDVEAARLMVLQAADALDRVGNKSARMEISAAKIFVPNAIGRVLDAAIQMHGGSGVSDDTPLARMWVVARTLRIADGPDEVHLTTMGRLELSGKTRARL